MLAFATPMKTPPASGARWESESTFLDKLKGAALIASFIALLATFAMAVEWWDTLWVMVVVASGGVPGDLKEKKGG
jgi:hypothetical protein